MSESLIWAEATLDHRFADPALLNAALTHRSHIGDSYERLEFLGDRVLGCAVADMLYRAYPHESEGALSKRWAVLVSRETCAAVADSLELGPRLRLGKQARGDGGARSVNILGDAVEALIGALWLDGGWAVAAGFIERHWRLRLEAPDEAPRHPKSALQEWSAARGSGEPAYDLVGRVGAHHAPRFRVRVTVRGREPAEAEGGTKQEAETAAARAMLASLGA